MTTIELVAIELLPYVSRKLIPVSMAATYSPTITMAAGISVQWTVATVLVKRGFLPIQGLFV